MGRAVRALVALVVVGMLALSGCAGQNPTHAANVNGVVITEKQVDQVSQLLAKESNPPSAAGAQRANAVSLLVRTEVLKQVGQQQSAQVSDVERRGAYDANPKLAEYAKDPAYTSFMDDFIYTQLMLQKADQAKLVPAVEGTSVTLNPRYGTWDAKQAALTGDSGSLSVPASTLTQP